MMSIQYDIMDKCVEGLFEWPGDNSDKLGIRFQAKDSQFKAIVVLCSTL